MSDITDDEGLGMIEIVVSMLMLALLAVAFLPVLITGLKSTAANAVSATATQLANQAIESVRDGSYANCAALNALASSAFKPDGRSGQLQVVRVVTCVAGDGQPETVSVVVREASGDQTVLARATTLVRLGS
jgi:type II secretory pathway pseudopilin PulG